MIEMQAKSWTLKITFNNKMSSGLAVWWKLYR